MKNLYGLAGIELESISAAMVSLVFIFATWRQYSFFSDCTTRGSSARMPSQLISPSRGRHFQCCLSFRTYSVILKRFIIYWCCSTITGNVIKVTVCFSTSGWLLSCIVLWYSFPICLFLLLHPQSLSLFSSRYWACLDNFSLIGSFLRN